MCKVKKFGFNAKVIDDNYKIDKKSKVLITSCEAIIMYL